MAVYVVTYDLVRASFDEYEDVHNAIKLLSTDWAHVQLSTFLINSDMTTVQIRDMLASHFRTNEKLLVAPLGGEVAGLHMLGSQVSDWLRRNNYTVDL